MTIAVLAHDRLKEEFGARTFPEGIEIIYADSIRSLVMIEADAYFDLMFEYDHERIARLKTAGTKPVIVNSVLYTCRDIGAGIARINGWPTQLNRPIAELAVPKNDEHVIKELFQQLAWEPYIVPDVTGMVTPRVTAMIINEAAYALSEGISTREEIDLAMKLGTNYPYGPFEWLEKIGMDRVKQLLHELTRNNSRYTVAPMLQIASA